MKLIKQLVLFLGLVTLMLQISWAAPIAGHVILTKGNVTAVMENGDSRALKRRSEIFNGDVIKTGPAGSVQIRFVDKALMTIKANSEMNIESYLMAQQSESGDKEQVLMSLVKGGFRTITGTIGKGDKDAYKVNTPAASIGIRGTNYEVQQEADGGFVMGVYSGGIQVENEAGVIDLGEGADFNFTRVKPNSAPKGLLAPPSSLGENSATEQSEEESEGEETANEEGSEESDETNEEGDVAEGEGSEGDTNDAPAAIVENTTSDVDSNVTSAIDSKLTETIEDTKEAFIESGGIEDAILEALIAAGILQTGDTLDDLDPIYAELVDQWLANSNFDLVAAIQNLINQGVSSDFDFNNPYQGIDVDASGNPFDDSIITDQEYALGESGKLGFIAVPVNYNFGANDTPDVPLTEAMLQSALTVNSSNIGSVDYRNTSTKIDIYYEVLIPSTVDGVTTYLKEEYRVEIPVEANINGVTQLMDLFNDSLNTGIKLYKESGDTSTEVSLANSHINFKLIDVTMTGEYALSISSTPTSDEFVSTIELDVHSNNITLEQNLYDQIGTTPGTADEEWYASSEIELIIANGSWDATNNKPIMLEIEEDDGGNRIAVIRKPNESNDTIASFLDYFDIDINGDDDPEIPASCGSGENSSPTPCDIQIDNAGGRSNISWGIWITEPGETGDKIHFDEIKDTGENESNTEDSILAFWIAAERADISQLTGTASFSADNLDCTNLSQCIGFADDGLVRNLSASFNVNFDTGSITNGNLNIQTATDLDSEALSTWDVNFTGTMMKDGIKHPEFLTESLNGQINNQDANIIGNIGGIFVKPGDKFAGAYNLGTIDDSGADNHKHAAGVFSMDKQ